MTQLAPNTSLASREVQSIPPLKNWRCKIKRREIGACPSDWLTSVRGRGAFVGQSEESLGRQLEALLHPNWPFWPQVLNVFYLSSCLAAKGWLPRNGSTGRHRTTDIELKAKQKKKKIVQAHLDSKTYHRQDP